MKGQVPKVKQTLLNTFKDGFEERAQTCEPIRVLLSISAAEKKFSIHSSKNCWLAFKNSVWPLRRLVGECYMMAVPSSIELSTIVRPTAEPPR